jgi:hypothetical protein
MWMEAPKDFWDIVSKLESSSVLFLHKIPSYLVVASESASMVDLQPLLETNRGFDRARLIQGIVATAQYYCLGKLFRRATGDWWLEFARNLINTGERDLLQAGRIVLHCAVDELMTLCDSQRVLLNRASVDLINQYLRAPDVDIRVAAPLTWVCKTIANAPEISVGLIRSLLSGDQIQERGYIIAPPLAGEIKEIWGYDPVLAVALYEVVFSYRENDQAVTSFSDSRIFRLTSTREQDYQGARYNLCESFPDFLRSYPAHATAALIGALRNIFQRDSETIQEAEAETFEWGARECHIANDARSIRYSDPHPGDDEGQMLAHWEAYLKDLPGEPHASDTWASIEEVLISSNESSEIWRSLLKAGCERPEFYSTRIAPLLSLPRILFGPGTRTMARNCLRNFAPHMSLEILQGIQRLVLNFSEYGVLSANHPSNDQYLTELKMMILAAIPSQCRIEEASAFLSRCDSQSVRHAEARADESDENVWTRSWAGDQDNLRETSPQEEDQIVISVRYLSNLSSEQVTEANIGDILGHIGIVLESLNEPTAEIGYRSASNLDWLVQGCCAVALSDLTLESLPTNFLFRIFRSCLSQPIPQPSEERLRQFDDSPSFGYPDPSILAAKGFLALVARSDALRDEWRELLSTVAYHVHPKIRFQLTEAFHALMTHWPEFVLETVEHWVQETTHGPGRFALVSNVIRLGVLWRLRDMDQSRTDQIINQFCDSVRARGSRELRTDCGSLIALYHIQLNVPWANGWIREATNSCVDYLYEIRGMLEHACKVVFRPFTESLNCGDAYFRANEIISVCLNRIHEALDLIRSDAAQSPPEWVKEAISLFEVIAIEFSRCIHTSVKHMPDSPQPSDFRRMDPWWERIESALVLCVMEPYPMVVYPLINGLNDVISRSPLKSVHWLAEITRLAAPYGLPSESSAADRTIETLEQLLADHRLDFRSDTLLSNVVDIIESYLRAGWPRAFEFATQLEAIFR